MDVVDHLRQILSEEPTRSGGYDVTPFTMLLVYEELDKHATAGNPPHGLEAASTHRYLKEKLADDPTMDVGNWWRSRGNLQAYLDEIERLREGREMTSDERIEAALNLIVSYGGIDGDHHKAWVIDQTVRLLVGPQGYPKFVADACDGEDGPETYDWNVGVAP